MQQKMSIYYALILHSSLKFKNCSHLKPLIKSETICRLGQKVAFCLKTSSSKISIIHYQHLINTILNQYLSKIFLNSNWLKHGQFYRSLFLLISTNSRVSLNVAKKLKIGAAVFEETSTKSQK